MNNPFTCSNTC